MQGQIKYQEAHEYCTSYIAQVCTYLHKYFHFHIGHQEILQSLSLYCSCYDVRVGRVWEAPLCLPTLLRQCTQPRTFECLD